MKRKHRNIGDRVQLIVDEVLHLLGHSSRSSADAARGRSLQLTRLEERMLMSASPMAMIAEVALVAMESSPVADAVDAGTNTTAVTDNIEYSNPDGRGPDSTIVDSDNSTDTTPEIRGVELVVIDSRVQDADALLTSLLSDDRDVRLLRLDANENGLTQITAKLEQLGNVSAIHLLSHGREGEILLGSTVLNADTLTLYAPELLAWQHSLTANADLLLYSCDLAESPEGMDFIASLSQLTGADVAASTDATGSQSFGGDWELEYQLGAIETHVFGDSSMIGDWSDLLGVITVSTTDDVLDGDTSSIAALLGSRGTDGFISLREAIIATNNTAGADTIFLTAGTFTFSIDGQGENAALSGDLDITDSLTISGAGSGLSIINAGSLDRVFELRGAIAATIEDVTIRGGSLSSSHWGGGVLTDNGSTLNLSRVVVTGNSTGSGAGIYNYGTLVATDTVISNNTGSSWGGGLYNDGGNVTLNRVTISGNTADKDGGGIEHAGSGASMSLTNVTLSGNIATGNGGGLWTSRSLTATNVTIAFNDAASGDGIFMQGGGAEVVLRNSVLYNTSGVNANRAVTSLGNNLDSDFSAGLTGPADQSGIDPLLDATLQDNGGFVTTHRLQSGSAAIDTGSTVSAPTVDARNSARDGAPDIGAYEVQGLLASRAESLVNTATTNTQSTSSESRGSTHAVAAARDDSHVIVWSSLNQDGGGWGVYGQRFDAAGNKVGVEFLINQTTTNDQKYATVAMNGRGDFVVSWTSVSQDGSGNGVYARRYDAAGTALGNEFRVGMTSTGDQDSPVVAMAADGRFLIVWEGQGAGDADGIFGRWYAANGAPSGSEVRINPDATGVQEDPSVAMAPDGRAVVVWSDSTSGLRAQRFTDTGAFAGTEISVESNGSAGSADVEMATDGSFVVAYRQTLFDLGVYFRRFDNSGTPLSLSAQIANSTTLGNQTDPSIAMDDTGNFLIVWEGIGNGDADGVFGRLYTDSGTALNSFEFRINGTATGTQSMASAAMLTGGNFVVTWSGASAADSSGVYSRQFTNTPPTITAISNQTIPENGATAALGFTIGDAESSTSTLVVTATSSNSALVLPSGFLFTGFGANHTITVTPNANYSGTTTITVTVDDNFKTTSSTFLLTVTLVNDDPVITSNGGGDSATISVAENATVVTTVQSIDSDLPSQTLTYSINGGGDDSLFAINSTTGVLTFVTAPDYESPVDNALNNSYRVNVRVTDGMQTDVQALTVTVTDVNEAPVITSNGGGSRASISVAENTTTVTTVTSTDPDLPGQTLTYSISGGADAAKFAINSTTGALTFAAAPDDDAPTDSGADNIYDVIVQASDGTLTDTQSIAVTVTALNDNTPVITSNGGGTTAAISIAENTTAVTTVIATDADLPTQTLTYSISGGADAAKFAINSTTGALTFVSARNFESPADVGANNVYDVIVLVSDGTLNDTQAIAVTVTAVNDNTPVITSNGGGVNASISVAENATTVTTVTATDADLPAQTLTYSISGGADAAKFAINSATGVLTFATAPNFELPKDNGANNVYDVIVQVTDGTTADTQSIAVSVSNVNDNTPVVTVGQSFSVSEVAPVGTSLGVVVATDADAGTIFGNWTITAGNNAGIFAINTSTGALTVVNSAGLDYEITTAYTLTLRVSDGVRMSLPQTVSINVTPANDNSPVIASNGGGVTAAVSVAENTTAVTTVVATDADLPTQSLTYSISGGADAAKFAINSSTGLLSFVVAPDYELAVDSGSNNVYDLIVRVSDGTWTDMQAIAVTVTSLNDNSPVITSNGGGATASIDIAENLTAATTVFATDADQPAQSLTYSIVGGADAAKFTINSTTGVLSLLSAPDFETPTDAGSNNIYDVSVRTSDGTSSDTQAISVRVTDINEAPTANAGGPYAISEGDALTVVAGLSVDPEGQSLTYAWDIDGDGLFTDATGSTATLTWSELNSLASPVNDNGTRAIALRVTDAGGISTVATTTLTVTNTAPTVNVTGNPTTSSGTPYVINFSTTDPGADTITTYRVNWGDGATQNISGTAASATHTYLIPGGTRNITVIAIDEDGTFPMNGSPLVVTVLITAPSAPTLSDSVVPGLTNAAVVGTLNFTDPDSGDAHTWTVSDSRFTVVGSILKLKSGLQLNPVTEPTVAITVTVTDARGASGSANFTLRVNNPPVSASDAYAVDGTQQLSIGSPALGVLANDIDADGDALSVSLISGPSHAATFGLNADGTFWYRAAAGYSGIDTFLYRVHDGENPGAVTTVTLTVNQPASLTYTSLVSTVAEHQTLSTPLKVGTFTIVDDSFGTNTLTLTGSDAALFALDGNHNLFLKAGLTIDYGVQTRFDVTVLLDDVAISGTPDASRSLVVNVQDINAAPVASTLPNVVVLEDTSPGTISTASAFFDSDGDALNYAVQMVSQTPGLIKTININQTTGRISYSLNANAFGTAMMRVTGSDLLNARASVEFQLVVQSVNDAPVAVAYSGSTFREQALTSAAAGVLTSMSDAEHDPLTVTLVSGPANGTVALQANGSFVYTPNAGFQGTDTFRFVASDGILLSNVGTARISVLPQFIGQQPGSSSGTSGFGTPASTGTGGTSGTSGNTGLTSTGSGTAGNSGTGNSGATNSQSGTGSGSSAGTTTGITTVSPPSGVLNPTGSGAETETNENDDNAIIGFLQSVEDVATKRILVSASQNSFESQDRNSSNDSMRRTNEAFASHNFDATFNQSDSTAEMSSLNAEREALYRQLAGRVDQQSDAVAEQLEKNEKLKGRVVGSVGVVTTGFSVGYLFWAVRLGTLASGLLAQVPAWSMLDPLLVIDGDQKEEEDKESLQNIIDRQQAKVNKAQEPPEPEPTAHIPHAGRSDV